MFLLSKDQKTYFEEHADEILKEKGISKTAFAKAMGVAPQNANKLFGTKNAITLCSISDYLSIPLKVLLLGYNTADKEIHGCIYIDGEPNLVSSKQELENLLNTL